MLSWLLLLVLKSVSSSLYLFLGHIVCRIGSEYVVLPQGYSQLIWFVVIKVLCTSIAHQLLFLNLPYLLNMRQSTFDLSFRHNHPSSYTAQSWVQVHILFSLYLIICALCLKFQDELMISLSIVITKCQQMMTINKDF